MANLTAPNGVVVSVDDSKVDGLLARGFKKAEKTKKASTSKSTSSKSSK